MGKACRFEFEKGVKPKLIEDKVDLAIRTAEHAFGETKVRLSVAYLVKKNKAIIDVSNEIGKYVARVFTGFMTESVGEDKFTVDCIKTKN